MELIQEIGSYAGLAAILGLAVLSALYFSQARDVRRLRDWAGRAPERTTEPAAQPTRVVARPVPRPPGAEPTQTGLKPAAGAVASSAGAAPAVATGPAAATPAAARSAGTAAGPEDGEGVSQDTMAHPPPADSDGAGDDDDRDDEDLPEQVTGDSPQAVEDYEPDDEQLDDEQLEDEQLEDDDFDDAEPEDEHGVPLPEEHWEDDDFDRDTDDSPAAPVPGPLASVPARPVPPPPRTVPATPAGARPATSTGLSRSPSATGPVLPPYERSRPGGDPWYRTIFSSPGRAALVVGLAVLVLAAATLAGLRLAGGDDDPAGPSAEPGAGQTADAGGAGNQDGPGGAPIDPADVTVSVLNGTTVTGLASSVGDTVEAEGYQLGTVTNSTDQTRAESVVFYAEGAEAEAEDVSRRLDIPQREPIDAATQGLAGDASVVVVVGADKS